MDKKFKRLKYACYTLNYINTNPAEHVHAPRIDKIESDPAHIFTQEEIERILKTLCKCKKVSLEDVVNAVNNGADTTEKVEEVTGAGSPCGKCRRLIENIIELKR